MLDDGQMLDDGWMDGWIQMLDDRQIDGGMDRCWMIDGWMDDRGMEDVCVDVDVDVDVDMDGWMYRWIDGWMMDRWIWIDGWMLDDGRMDGWIQMLDDG